MSWIQTYSGRKFNFLHLENNKIDITDIAHSLSMQCRFMGHIKTFYSVAEHCCRVMDILPPELQKWGLLHDAAEAYTLDIPRPMKQILKRSFPEFVEWEGRVEQSVWGTFGLHGPIPTEVKKADNLLLLTERRDLCAIPPEDWDFDQCADNTMQPLLDAIDPWSWKTANIQFLLRWKSLT